MRPCDAVASKGREETVSVIVQFIVKVPNVDRFVATSEKFRPMMEEMGSRNGAVYEDENERPRPDARGVREVRRPVQ